MSVRITATGRVVCRATVELPMSARVAWGQLRDFRSSASHDPFHAGINIEGGVPRAGAALKILHRHLLWQLVRVGRILRWQEGSGFAFSDLCKGDTSRAFPHVLSYQLEAVSADACRLTIRAGGKMDGWCSTVDGSHLAMVGVLAGGSKGGKPAAAFCARHAGARRIVSRSFVHQC